MRPQKLPVFGVLTRVRVSKKMPKVFGLGYEKKPPGGGGGVGFLVGPSSSLPRILVVSSQIGVLGGWGWVY